MHTADTTRALDLRGLKCPLPALYTRRALAQAAEGARIEVICTDPMSVIDIPHLVRELGQMLESAEREGDLFRFRIRRRSGGGV